VIFSTFGPEGPNTCSGLDVVHYDENALHKQFGVPFRREESSKDVWSGNPKLSGFHGRISPVKSASRQEIKH
jgi:hypothetical protein